MDIGEPIRRVIAEPLPEEEPLREPSPTIPAEPVKVPA